MLKLLLTAVVLSSLLISFILPSHWAFLGMCTLLSLRADLIPSRQEGVPSTLPQQLITQKPWKGIRGVWRKMSAWADRNRGFTLTQCPPFPVVSLMLTHFCSVNLQVHWPCLVHWVTAGPKHISASRTSFPEILYVAYIPVTPGKTPQTLLLFYWWHVSCPHWLMKSSRLISNQIKLNPYHLPSLLIVIIPKMNEWRFWNTGGTACVGIAFCLRTEDDRWVIMILFGLVCLQAGTQIADR